MPSIFSPIPAEIERKAPGTGGKPPVDRRPTGGGGGGGDDDWRNPRRGPREVLVSHPRLCLLRAGRRHDVLRRAGGALLCAPGRHAHGSAHPAPDRRLASGPAAAHPLSEYCGPAAEQPDHGAGAAAYLPRDSTYWRSGWDWAAPRCAAPCPGLRSLSCWVSMFLGGQALAWRQLTAQGFAFDRWATPASYFFYVMTGFTPPI